MEGVRDGDGGADSRIDRPPTGSACPPPPAGLRPAPIPRCPLPSSLSVIGFGGGCHWCTEAVFQALRGVERVEQGWICSAAPHDAPSEAVRVRFDPGAISLRTLVEIHLLTHASTSAHAMRAKYRSAVYTFSPSQHEACLRVLGALRAEHGAAYVTQVLPFAGFEPNRAELLDYYRTRPDAPFCTTYIAPKLRKLMRTHAAYVRLPAGRI